jgi:hypothetical protein
MLIDEVEHTIAMWSDHCPFVRSWKEAGEFHIIAGVHSQEIPNVEKCQIATERLHVRAKLSDRWSNGVRFVDFGALR